MEQRNFQKSISWLFSKVTTLLTIQMVTILNPSLSVLNLFNWIRLINNVHIFPNKKKSMLKYLCIPHSLKIFLSFFVHGEDDMLRSVVRTEDNLLESILLNLWVLGMEPRLSSLVAGIFTSWTILSAYHFWLNK